ncbi:leucine-rich repeat protein, partial [Odoribacter sp. OttesenSCG-928-L07]|nr:leucine-rich repeat protein [Odoribacter sp. OttesenSCG-928-L07]
MKNLFTKIIATATDIAAAKSILLALFIVLTGATAWAQPQQIGTSTTYWDLSISGGDTTLIISGTGDMPDFVNVNDAPWYSINKTIHHLQIGDSITRIGNWAIYDFTKLSSANIGKSLTSIGNSAFRFCSALPSITLPYSLTSIGNNAFEDCTALTEITNLRPTPITINANVFSGVSITACSLKVPLASVSLYQGAAVWQNFNIAGGYVVDVVVNNPAGGSVTGGGIYPSTAVLTATPEDGYTFRYWSSNGVEISTANPLNLSLANDTTVMAHFAQQIETSSTWWELIINESDTTLKITGTGAMPDFAYSTYTSIPWYSVRKSLHYLEIGDNITQIGGYVFIGCSSLSSVTIPDLVTSIGDYAFSACSGLSSVIIPDLVTGIGSRAFNNCTGLTSVIIGNSVTNIRDAFFGCSGLTSVIIPNSVTSIGSYAFSGCTGLTSVTIGNSVTSIENYTFNNCTGLNSVTIGNSVTSIGYDAFKNCTGLTAIDIAAANPNYSSLDGILYNKDKTTIIMYPRGKTDISFAIPNSVTSIGISAFRYCSSLSSVTIPNSVTDIKGGAFYECTGLTEVTIPNSVTSIGYETFFGCSSLLSVTIPNSVTSIGGSAFKECTSLTEIINHNPEPLAIEANVFTGVNKPACTLKVATSAVSKYEAAAVWQDFNIVGGGYLVIASANNAAYGKVNGEGLYPTNTALTVTATTNPGYVFINWTVSGIVISTESSYSFTVTDDITLTANFKAGLSNLTVSEGTLTPAFHQDSLNYSVQVDIDITSITLTAHTEATGAIVIGDGTHSLNTGVNTFTILVIDQDGVNTLTYTVKVSRITIDVDEWRIENGEWRIYPNPASDKLRIENGEWRISGVEIYNLNGRMVKRIDNPSRDAIHCVSTEIDISDLQRGIYFVKIKTE